MAKCKDWKQGGTMGLAMPKGCKIHLPKLSDLPFTYLTLNKKANEHIYPSNQNIELRPTHQKDNANKRDLNRKLIGT